MGSALGWFSLDSYFVVDPSRPEDETEALENTDMLLDPFLDSLVKTIEPAPAEPAQVDPMTDPMTDPVEPVLPFTQGSVYKSLRRNECLRCGKKFNRSEHLKNHVRAVHYKKKSFRCPVCPKTFALKSQLSVHMRVHNNERPFACLHPGCNRRFRQKMHMLRHMRVHTGKKPYACPVCKRAFSQKSSMKRHIGLVHHKLLGC